MSDAVVRPAQSPEDLAAVRALFRAYGDHLATTAAIHIEDLDGEIASLPSAYLVLLLATINGQSAGCVALKALKQVGLQACELKRLWVSPPFRGHRLGKQLVNAAIEYATRFEFSALYLDTAPAAMPEANRLYSSLGFERIDRYNANPVADLNYFRLSLPAPSLPIEPR